MAPKGRGKNHPRAKPPNDSSMNYEEFEDIIYLVFNSE